VVTAISIRTVFATVALSLAAAGVAFSSGSLTGRFLAVVKPSLRGSVHSVPGFRNESSLAGGAVLVLTPLGKNSLRESQQSLERSGKFARVEFDRVESTCAVSNDPMLPNQGFLFEISAFRAHDFTTGSGTVIAIIDGGIDLSHPDLAPSLVPGFNSVSGLAQLDGGDVTDIRSNGHGTRVAGIAAAVGNNNIGICGVGPGLSIMPVRVTNDAATGATPRSEILEGIQWALDHGADVASVSYTGVENADVEAMGLYSRQVGAHLVWAAGNTNNNWTSFDHLNVTVVGGLGTDGALWSQGLQGTGFGRGVDIFAPCVQLLTTSKGGGFGFAPAGTSFATPQVAAALALLRSRYPNESSTRLEELLLRRTKDLGAPGLDLTYGWGRLNVGAAVENNERKYRLTKLTLPIGYDLASALSINTSGTVVGKARQISTGQIVGFKWSAVTGAEIIPVPQAYPQYDELWATRVNNSGQIILQMFNRAANEYYGEILEPSGSFTSYQMGNFAGNQRLFQINDIAENGLAGGVESEYAAGSLIHPDTIYWTSPTSPALVLPGWLNTYDVMGGINSLGYVIAATVTPNGDNGYPNLVNLNTGEVINPPHAYSIRAYMTRIKDSGYFTGYVRGGNPVANRAQRWRISPGNALGASFEDYPDGSEAYDINSDGDTVGYANGYGKVLWGLSTGYLHNLLTEPLPPDIAIIDSVTGISDSGDLVGYGRLNLPGQPQFSFVAWRDDNPTFAVSLGQIGETPTYIGSIPPSLSVTFTNPDGTAIPNTTVQLNYSGTSGRVALDLPASVTGSYRMYLQCNSNAIPSYVGPNFLSRIYPPLSESPLPIDTTYAPLRGPLVNGHPVFELFAGDADGSGEIDAADIDLEIAHFGTVSGGPGFEEQFDLDGSGEVDAADIDRVIENFGLVSDPEP